MAIGFTVGAAITTVAKSLVNDIIMPPVGLVLGKTDLSNMYFVLKEGNKQLADGATLQDAQTVGAVTMNIGMFINHALAFALVAMVMFVFIRAVSRVERELDDHFNKDGDTNASSKKCRFCRSTVDIQASRCPYCTSELEQVLNPG